jgi:hypothetical protein
MINLNDLLQNVEITVSCESDGLEAHSSSNVS